MAADPHGNGGGAGTNLEGRKQELLNRLNKARTEMANVKKAIPKKLPRRSPGTIRVQPFRSIRIFLAIAAMMLLTATFLVVATRKQRPATVESISYDATRQRLTVWLRADGMIPASIFRHYRRQSSEADCSVLGYTQDPESGDVHIEISASDDYNVYLASAGFRTRESTQ